MAYSFDVMQQILRDKSESCFNVLADIRKNRQVAAELMTFEKQVELNWERINISSKFSNMGVSIIIASLLLQSAEIDQFLKSWIFLEIDSCWLKHLHD